MDFIELDIDELIVRAVVEKDYGCLTEIQEKSMGFLIEGRDLLGIAQTGTGKTAAFAIPILERIHRVKMDIGDINQVRALVLVPTRELAIQIGESFTGYGKYVDVPVGVVFGGITPKQHIKVLKRQPSILVATPGRLLDLIDKDAVDLSFVEMFVLDEADRMLDLGMKKDVNKIISLLPKKKQTMLFSATMPQEVAKMVNTILRKPIKIEVKRDEPVGSHIDQFIYLVEEPDKTEQLLKLLESRDFESALIFVRTKKKADKVAKAINLTNIRTKAIHSDKNQSERLKVLELFKNKEAKILVATDIAARGIDVDGISLVINMDIPIVPETYIHRIGRTGRAGQSGLAISFCSKEEKENLHGIETLIGEGILTYKEPLA